MAIRAVIFDYGKVLSALPDADAHTSLVSATGLDDAAFEDHYWAHRHAYDRGDLNSQTYWKKIASEAGFTLTPGQLTDIIAHDCRMWGNLNDRMVAWAQELIDSGMRVAVLSNMGDATRDYLLGQYPWLLRFNYLTWSCELNMAKPEPGIYQHTLEKLGVQPDEALFIDDIQRNIDAARALGIQAVLFTDVDTLREQLIERGLDSQMPLPPRR